MIMAFNDSLNQLKQRVSRVLSPRRFEHTLGVEEMSAKIGELCLPDSVYDLRIAALLHDVAKEIDREELAKIASTDSKINADDFKTPAALHAFCGPLIIKRDFPQFAKSIILNAVFNHTTADSDISVFDEIIYLSDYIEKGRTYTDCITVREYFFRECSMAKSLEQRLNVLHRSVYMELDNTVRALNNRGSNVNPRTYSAMEYFKDFL